MKRIVIDAADLAKLAPESDIQRTVLAYLRHAGVFHWRSSAGQRGRKGTAGYAYPAGCSDILACVCGRFVAIEVKSVTGRLRPSQKVWRAALESAGGLYWVIRNLEELKAALRSIGFPAP